MGNSQNPGTGTYVSASPTGTQSQQATSMPQSPQPSKLKQIGTKIAKKARTVGQTIENAWQKRKKKGKRLNFSNFQASDASTARYEEERMSKKGFFERFITCFIPMNFYGLILLYFLLQDFVIDAFVYNFNYNSPALIYHHFWACFFIGLIILFRSIVSGSDDPEQGILSQIFNVTVYLVLVFGVGLSIEFILLPILSNLVYNSFLTRVGLTVFSSKNLEVIFARSLKPYWTFIALLLFGKFTRFSKGVITFIFFLFILTNFGAIDDTIRSSISIATTTKYYTTGKEEAKVVIDQIKANFHKYNPVSLFTNYLEGLREEFGEEHIDGDYAGDAFVSGVIFEEPYSTYPLVVFESPKGSYPSGEEVFLETDVNVITKYVRNPQNDCLMSGLCDPDVKVKLTCCVDNSNYVVYDDNPNESSSCLDYDGLTMEDLLIQDDFHTFYVKAKDPNQVGAEDNVKVDIIGTYDFVTTSNKDFRFAEKSLIARCKTQDYYSSMQGGSDCLHFSGEDPKSESSSGPIIVGIGTPEKFDATVLSIDTNKDTQHDIPLLISITNQGDGYVKEIKEFYLALPDDIEPSERCSFKKIYGEEAECGPLFGEGIYKDESLRNYVCYEYTDDFKEALEKLSDTSILCIINPTKDILDGDKATKNIKVYLNYTYEINASTSLTFIDPTKQKTETDSHGINSGEDYPINNGFITNVSLVSSDLDVVNEYKNLIEQFPRVYSAAYDLALEKGMDPALIMAMVTVEGGFNIKYINEESDQAEEIICDGDRGESRGPMQVNKNTFGGYTLNYEWDDMYSYEPNIRVGMNIFQEYKKLAGDNIVYGLLYYNSGPNAYQTLSNYLDEYSNMEGTIQGGAYPLMEVLDSICENCFPPNGNLPPYCDSVGFKDQQSCNVKAYYPRRILETAANFRLVLKEFVVQNKFVRETTHEFVYKNLPEYEDEESIFKKELYCYDNGIQNGPCQS